MIEFKISVPGRLSLFGEHVINYDKSSLKASINLRTTLTFTELPHVCPEDIIQVEFLQIGLFLSIPLRQFLDFYRNCTINEYDNEYNNLHDQVLQFTSNHYSFRTEHQRAIAQASIYLLVYISCRENIDIKSFCVRLFTQLIIGRKIVCLASSTVYFAACFLRWSNLQKGAIDDLDSSDLNKIHSYAVRCKRISCESGMIDVAACTYGSIIEHRIGEILRIIPFFEMLTVTILLVDSGQTQNLEAQTQQVTELMNTYPKFARSVFNNFDCVTSVASNVFQKLGPIYANDEFGSETKRLTIMMQHNLLASVINMNQRLLHLLKVSNFRLDKICLIAICHEFCGKYTDIGGGRCAYIWYLQNASLRRIFRLSAELKTNGFEVMQTTLAWSGVRVEY